MHGIACGWSLAPEMRLQRYNKCIANVDMILLAVVVEVGILGKNNKYGRKRYKKVVLYIFLTPTAICLFIKQVVLVLFRFPNNKKNV